MSIATEKTAAALAQQSRREIIIVSHSSLFYWWPVWAVCFLLAIITFFTSGHLALAPSETKLFRSALQPVP
jgi:hypothetical protein